MFHYHYNRLRNLSFLICSCIRQVRQSTTKPRTAKVTASNAMAYYIESKMNTPKRNQQYKYFLVLDFEATCDFKKKMNPQEIIEFPVLKLSAETLKVEATFHEYIKPRIHHQLTPFCMELTSITQPKVDNGIDIEDALKQFNIWMEENELLEPENPFVFVTYGDWDLKTMLPGNCDYFGIKVPGYFNQWVNIKKAVAEATGNYPAGMLSALQWLRLKHEGRHHSGIDDCKNISKIVVEMIKRDYYFNTLSRKR